MADGGETQSAPGHGIDAIHGPARRNDDRQGLQPLGKDKGGHPGAAQHHHQQGRQDGEGARGFGVLPSDATEVRRRRSSARTPRRCLEIRTGCPECARRRRRARTQTGPSGQHRCERGLATRLPRRTPRESGAARSRFQTPSAGGGAGAMPTSTPTIRRTEFPCRRKNARIRCI